MSSHTPGPWISSGLPSQYDQRVVVDGPGVVAVLPRDSRIGADVDANARLIAAAPDLLAICQEIADSRCDLGSSERRMRLYHAIHQATGTI